MSAAGRFHPGRQPQEVLFFLFLGAFGLGIGVVYWLAGGEPAGLLLLVGFGVATGAVAIALALDPRASEVRRRAASGPGTDRRPEGDPGDRVDPGGEGPTSSGTGGIDRPYLDETGRLPADTLAPMAVGLGVSIAATGLIFGLAPVVVGLLPLAWGANAWLRGASAEHSAASRVDVVRKLQPRPEPPASRSERRSP